jgi:hypothetical protein
MKKRDFECSLGLSLCNIKIFVSHLIDATASLVVIETNRYEATPSGKDLSTTG